MLKLHQGLSFKAGGWSHIINVCRRACNDISPSLVTKEALHKFELDILFAANFNLVPIGRIFGVFNQNGEDELTWKFAEARMFRGEDTSITTEILLPRSVERFNQCMSVRVLCTTVREVQIFHHWSVYCMVEAAHKAVMGNLYEEFSCHRFPQCPQLEAVRLRLGEMAKEDFVVANTVSRYCMTWYKMPTTVISRGEFGALSTSGKVMTDVGIVHAWFD